MGTAGINLRLCDTHIRLQRHDETNRQEIRNLRPGRRIMDAQTLTYLFVFLSFSLYIGIAIWSKVSSTGEFYVAGGGVHPVANGMATAADWMSAASFISMAGIIAFMGYDGTVYLMGWTGGYVILALLLAPYLRKFGNLRCQILLGLVTIRQQHE